MIFKIITSFFRKFWLRRNDVNESTNISVPTSPVVDPLVFEKPSQQAATIDWIKWHYRHTKQRVFERYNGEIIDFAVWKGWNNQIACNDPVILYCGVLSNSNKSKLYRVWFKTKPILVVARKGMVVTALPINSPVENAMVQKAARARLNSAKPEKSKGKVKATVKKLPPLPPAYLRPKRNEEVLRQLKEQALGRQHYDD